MVRVLCLGMSALDAIYRVPAIPDRADQGAGHRVHRMRRRHGGQRQRGRRPAGGRRVLLGPGRRRRIGHADPGPARGRRRRYDHRAPDCGLRFAVGRHPGRRRRRAPGVRLQRSAARPRPVVAPARAGRRRSASSWPTFVGRPARPRSSMPRVPQASRRSSTVTSVLPRRSAISHGAPRTWRSRSRVSRWSPEPPRPARACGGWRR